MQCLLNASGKITIKYLFEKTLILIIQLPSLQRSKIFKFFFADFYFSQIPRNEFQFFSSRDDQQSNTFPDLMQNPGKSVGQGIFQSLNFNSSKVKNQDFDVQAHQQSGNLFGTRSTMNYNYANSFAQRTGSPKVFQESANVPEAGHKKFVQVRRDYRRLSGDLSMPQSKQVQKIIAEERLPGRRASTSALQDYIAQRDADIHNAQVRCYFIVYHWRNNHWKQYRHFIVHRLWEARPSF